MKDLLTPRFEVIETYPKSKFKKGDILERIPNATNNWYNANNSLINGDILLDEIEQFPHLFRKMNWWEKRTAEQMPKFLKQTLDDGKTTCEKIISWDMKHLIGMIDDTYCCDLMLWKGKYQYQPATEEEFNIYSVT